MTSKTTKPTKEISRVNWQINDFCAAHGICRTSCYEEIKRGELTTISYGRRKLIPDKVARAWQARKMKGGNA